MGRKPSKSWICQEKGELYAMFDSPGFDVCSSVKDGSFWRLGGQEEVEVVGQGVKREP